MIFEGNVPMEIYFGSYQSDVNIRKFRNFFDIYDKKLFSRIEHFHLGTYVTELRMCRGLKCCVSSSASHYFKTGKIVKKHTTKLDIQKKNS